MQQGIVLAVFLYTMIGFGVFKLFQAENVRDAAWGCDWIGTPVQLQRCLVFIIATANK
jgi:hypothetical protein